MKSMVISMRDTVVLMAVGFSAASIQLMLSINTVLIIKIMYAFDVNNADVSWIVSLFNGFQNLSGNKKIKYYLLWLIY